MNIRNFALASGVGGLGLGGMQALSGNMNPADENMQYLQNIPGAISPYLSPYTNAGSQSVNNLQGQYGNITNNPGAALNKIGSNYQQSPGFQFALQQALQGAGHAAARGGMAGSPQAMQQNEQIATQLGNQDYYNWLGQATNLYGQGLQGEQGLAGFGLHAGTTMADQIAQALSNQSGLGYAGQAAQNQAQGSMFNNLAGGAANLALAAFL